MGKEKGSKINGIVTGGYQPTESKLDAKNPPKGGTGVQTKLSTTDNSNDQKK